MANLTKPELDAAISRHAVSHLMSMLVHRGAISPQERDYVVQQTVNTLMNFEICGVPCTIDPFYHPLRQVGLG